VFQQKKTNPIPEKRSAPAVRSSSFVQNKTEGKPCVDIANTWFDLTLAEKMNHPHEDIIQSLKNKFYFKNETEKLLGIVGQCQIPSCDIHMLTKTDDIINHISLTESISPEFQNSRIYWKSPHEGAVALLVYSDHMDVILIDGSIIPFVS
jgi:hypothetical protein